MPNQMSPDSRRTNFIINREFYEGLEARALAERISVGELIRRALEEKYPEIPLSHPVIQTNRTSPPIWSRIISSALPRARKHVKNKPGVARPKRNAESSRRLRAAHSPG